MASVTCFHLFGTMSVTLLGMKRLVDFAHNMATFAVVFSLFVFAVVFQPDICGNFNLLSLRLLEVQPSARS